MGMPGSSLIWVRPTVRRSAVNLRPVSNWFTAVFTLGHVECVFLGDEEAAAATSQVGGGSQTFSSGDFASRAYDRSLRVGFGPKKKEKSGGAGALMFLGVLAILACGAAIYFAGELA